MKLYLSTLMLVGIVFASRACEPLIKMPSQEILAERLSKHGFNDLSEKTKIHERLGNQIICPAMVSIQAGTDLYGYYEQRINDRVSIRLRAYLYKTSYKLLINNKKVRAEYNTLLYALLMDSPEALAALANLGYYQAKLRESSH